MFSGYISNIKSYYASGKLTGLYKVKAFGGKRSQTQDVHSESIDYEGGDSANANAVAPDPGMLSTPARTKELPAEVFSASANRATDEQLKEIRKAVEEKVKDFNPDEEQDEDVEFKGDSIGWSDLWKPYANCCDLFLLISGFIMAIIFGGSLPGFCLFFGEMIDSMGKGTNEAIQIEKILTDKLAAGEITVAQA